MRRLVVLAAPTCRTGPGRSGCRSRSRRPLAYREVLEKRALDQGMRTLWDDGLAKVAAGVTTLEEVGRVLP